MKKILITGSSGRVGGFIAKHLASSNKIIGIDIVPGKFTSVVSNILSPKVSPLIQSADAIIHCAALHAPHIEQHSEQEFWDANVATTEYLLKHCDQHASMVLTSSTSVFGSSLVKPGRTVWVDEDLAVRPRDIYDSTKLAAEGLVKQDDATHRSMTVLRISRCFPEQERLMAIYRLHRGVDLRDVVQAHTLALNRSAGQGLYIISAPIPFKRADLIELYSDAASLIKQKCPSLGAYFKQNNWSLPVSIDRVYSSELASKELGYRPSFGVDRFLNGDRQPDCLALC